MTHRVIQIYRGTEAQNNAYTGSAGELTMDTTNNELRLHDGSTVGGHEISGNIKNKNTAAGATNPIYDWVGTLAEYESQEVATNHPDWVCYITDDLTAQAYEAYTKSQTNTLLANKVNTGHEVIAFQEPTSANNYTWYRKYADGWVEQGQKKINIGNGSYGLFNLPIVMSGSGDYIAQAGCCQVNSNGMFGATSTVAANSYSTTQVRVGQYNSANATMDVWWEVKGMAA